MPQSPAERNFWALIAKHRNQVPAETYDYVYRIGSAAVIGQKPELFGFDFASPFTNTNDSPADRGEDAAR
jgi:hypothetical protein